MGNHCELCGARIEDTDWRYHLSFYRTNAFISDENTKVEHLMQSHKICWRCAKKIFKRLFPIKSISSDYDSITEDSSEGRSDGILIEPGDTWSEYPFGGE